jgi:pSer/pThr/pTyr-binding forkhead associated (FHA) protein
VEDAVRALVIREASGAERVVVLEPDAVTIGRDPDSTIRLDSPYVSRSHARIEVRGEGAVLIDLGSRNGSRLNGAPVAGTAALRDADVITIADTTIECLAQAAEASTTRILDPRADEPGSGARLRVDALTYEVTIDERPLPRRLSAQEFTLLRHLYEHRDRVCTRQQLGDAVWGADRWDTSMLYKLVHRLKEKVEPEPERPRYLRSVPWVGYRLIA